MFIRIVFKIVSASIILLGFFLDHVEQYPLILKVIDKDYYYVSQALDAFYKIPSNKITKNDKAFHILCNKYFTIDKCKNSSVLGRTNVYQIMGKSSVGADFDLILNPDDGVLQSGVPYSFIKDNELDKFNKKMTNKGFLVVIIGLLVGII